MKPVLHFHGEPDRVARTRKLFTDEWDDRDDALPPVWMAVLIVVSLLGVAAMLLGAGWIALSGLVRLAE